MIEMGSIQSFVKRNKITADVVEVDENPTLVVENWDARHYKVVLRRKGKQMTVTFSVGTGWEREPDVCDVLDCLASDASGYENNGSFEEWCDEYGCDTDSRKAEKAYIAIGKQRRKLAKFLGLELYNELLWKTEEM